jgi:putative redox protein
MVVETVSLEWIREQQFLLRDRNGFPIFMAQPVGVNAADLLPLSLIGCTTYDVIAILRKQRQEVVDLTVIAESTRDPNPPWKFHRIHVHYKFIGRGLDLKKVKRAIELTEKKYCGVYAALKNSVQITDEVEIAEA